jgi:hypothetical protein
MVRRWHADPFGFLRPWNEVPTLMGSAPPACCLHLLIGFDYGEVDHGGRLTAMGGVWPLVIVEGDPATDACLGLRPGLPAVAPKPVMH